MIGGETVHAGMADAYGHLKLGGIGQVTGEALREITGEGMIYQQVGYLMRSGSPDSLDLMVAINYAVMAADLVIERQFGRLVALRNGNYTNVPLPVVRQGVKRVDVGALYDVEAYRPEDPPRRRQADVPVLSLPPTVHILGAHEDLPGRPAFGHRDQAIRLDAQGDGRGRGGRRLVRGRPDGPPPPGARGRDHRQGGRALRPHRDDGQPDRAAPALLRPRAPRGGRTDVARRLDRGDERGGALGDRVPDRPRRPPRTDHRGPGPGGPRAGRALRRRDRRPRLPREHQRSRRRNRDGRRRLPSHPQGGRGGRRRRPPGRSADLQRERRLRRGRRRVRGRGRHADVLRLEGARGADRVARVRHGRADARGSPDQDPVRRRLAAGGGHRGRRPGRARGGPEAPARGPRARPSPGRGRRRDRARQPGSGRC